MAGDADGEAEAGLEVVLKDAFLPAVEVVI